MDLQSFIQSGLLEAYVLGQCTTEERAQVERMAAEHEAVRAELASIEASLEAYATAHAVSPPDGLKAKIMERIDQEAANVSGKGGGKTALRIFQVLAFLFAALSTFLFLRQKDLGTEKEKLQITADTLQQQLLACNQALQQPDPVAELICDPATQRILVSNGKDINTIVYYNARLNRMAYDPYGLPAPKPDKHYQFWAIVDGQPVSLGMQAPNICESIRTVERPQAFAISEEDRPEGNPAPTTVLAVGAAG